MKTAFLFPGQGSQYVGMGKDFYRAYDTVFKPIYEEAEAILNIDMKTICFSGPEAILTSTDITQPAILMHSVGIARLLAYEGIQPNYVAGHSVGQFAALVAAEVLSFEEALRIVRKRGQCMSAVQKEGAMLATAFSKIERSEELLVLAEKYNVDLAGDNSPTQLVFAGETEGIELLLEEIQQIEGVRAKRLNVSHAFHSRLMSSMVEEFQTYCEEFEFKEAKIPLILNCSVNETRNPALIFQDVIDQCTKTVRWTETIQTLLLNEVNTFLEVGPKKTLTGLMRAYDYEGQALSNHSVMAFRKNLEKTLTEVV